MMCEVLGQPLPGWNYEEVAVGAYEDKVAVVTGAASGMGRSLALRLAHKGARLALCDVDMAALKQTAQLCEAEGATVMISSVDVSNALEVSGFAEEVEARYEVVHYLFNNAGTVHAGLFSEITEKEFDRIIDIDFYGVVHGTRAFLPLLRASGDGHLVNTSSVAGIIALPGVASYSAAKFAVRGFSESLRMELKALRVPVSVTCVHPGGIKTAIVERASGEGAVRGAANRMFDRLTFTSSDRAARTILRAASRGQARVLVGPDAYVYDACARIGATLYQHALILGARRVLPALGSAVAR